MQERGRVSPAPSEIYFIRDESLNIADVQAVITSAKARGREPLDRFLKNRLPEAKDHQIR